MRQDQAIQIFQGAVDSTIEPEQGAQWWADVGAELATVIDAPDTGAAAATIAWLHDDWRMVGLTPKRVAARIRRQAARVWDA